MSPSSPDAPPLSPTAGTALHRQVYMVLREQITRGHWAPGEALPKEESLCARFGVSRVTVRRALADLAAQGLLESRQGLGTFVRRDLRPARERPTLSFVDSLRKAAADTQVEVLSVEQEDPPPDVAELLSLEAGAKAVHAVRLRSVAGTPVMLTDAWVPSALGKRVTATALRKHALYEILLAQGVQLGRVVQEISAIAADPARAQVLKTDVGSPLLKLARVMHGRDERPVEYLNVYLSPERSRILMDIDASDVNTLVAGQVVHDVR